MSPKFERRMMHFFRTTPPCGHPSKGGEFLCRSSTQLDSRVRGNDDAYATLFHVPHPRLHGTTPIPLPWRGARRAGWLPSLPWRGARRAGWLPSLPWRGARRAGWLPSLPWRGARRAGWLPSLPWRGARRAGWLPSLPWRGARRAGWLKFPHFYPPRCACRHSRILSGAGSSTV